MTGYNVRGVLAALAVASTLAACSGPATSEQTPDGALGTDPSVAAPSTNGKPKPKVTRSPTAAGESDGSVKGSTGSRPSGGQGGTAPSRSTPVGAAKGALACMGDGAGDLERAGSPPGYADLVRACVREVGSSIRFELTLNGAAPARMPDDDSFLTLGFRLPRGGDAESYVGAEVHSGGWSAYLTHGQGRKALPGALTVKGATVYLTVPAGELGGAAKLTWKAESSWTRSQLLRTSYAFDAAPDAGNSTFSRAG